MALPPLNQPPSGADFFTLQMKRWFNTIWKVLKFFYSDGKTKLGINNNNPQLAVSIGSETSSGVLIGGQIYVSPSNNNTINTGYPSDVDTGAGSDIWINYRGYLDGFTRFRDFRIGDGKGNQKFLLTGSTGLATFTNQVTASQFNGSGAGLTGTAPSLTAGAVSSIAGNSLSSTQVFNAISLANNPDWYRVASLNTGFYNNAASTGIYCSQAGRVDVYNNGSFFVNNTAQATQFRSDATYNSTSTAHVDFSNVTSFSLAGSGSTTLPVGAGLLLIVDITSTGQTALYMIGGGTTAVLCSGTAFNTSSTPASGVTGIFWNGSAYQIKNGSLGIKSYILAFIKMRAAN